MIWITRIPTSNRIQSFFQELPPEISHLEHLQRLDVSSNLLSYLPSQIGDCFRLIELDVSSNRISDIPVDVGRLFRLNVSWLSRDVETVFRSSSQWEKWKIEFELKYV